MANSMPVNPLGQATRAAKRASAIGIIAILLSLIVIAGAFWGWQYFQQTKNQLKVVHTNNSNMNTVLTQVQQQLTLQQSQLTKLQTTINNVLDSKTGLRHQQLLSQVAFLIHLANLHLVIGHDSASCLKILVIAKNRLDGWKNPHLINLKQALSQDIDQLAKLPKINKTKLITQLDQINQQVQKLSILPSNKTSVIDTTFNSKSANSKNSHWYQQVGNYFANLKSLVTIRRHKYNAIPLISPSQETFLKLNIQSKILQTEWAILHQDNNLFHSSLKMIQTWLSNYFPDSNEIQPIINQLANMQQTDLKSKLPNINQSLIAISHVINEPIPAPDTGSDADKKAPTTKKQITTPNDTGVSL